MLIQDTGGEVGALIDASVFSKCLANQRVKAE